jgi:hypothetical protein
MLAYLRATKDTYLVIKNLVNVWPHRSMEKVAMHGTLQLSRGHQPSQPYREHRSNPRQSYDEALGDLALIGVEFESLEEIAQRTPRHPGPVRDLYLMQIERDCAARAAMVERLKLVEMVMQERRERIAELQKPMMIIDALCERVVTEALNGQLTIF